MPCMHKQTVSCMHTQTVPCMHTQTVPTHSRVALDMCGTKLPLVLTTAAHRETNMLRRVLHPQMDSDALESSLGGAAQQRTPLEVLTQLEGPTSSFQQDALDYFCYTQLAPQVSQPSSAP